MPRCGQGQSEPHMAIGQVEFISLRLPSHAGKNIQA